MASGGDDDSACLRALTTPRTNCSSSPRLAGGRRLHLRAPTTPCRWSRSGRRRARLGSTSGSASDACTTSTSGTAATSRRCADARFLEGVVQVPRYHRLASMLHHAAALSSLFSSSSRLPGITGTRYQVPGTRDISFAPVPMVPTYGYQI